MFIISIFWLWAGTKSLNYPFDGTIECALILGMFTYNMKTTLSNAFHRPLMSLVWWRHLLIHNFSLGLCTSRQRPIHSLALPLSCANLFVNNCCCSRRTAIYTLSNLVHFWLHYQIVSIIIIIAHKPCCVLATRIVQLCEAFS